MQIPVPEPRYAGFFIRLGATFVDLLLLMLLLEPVLGLLFGFPMPDHLINGSIHSLLSMAVTVVLWRLYGGTPGKLLLGLRVVDAQTLGPMTTPQSIGRYFAYLLSMLPLGAGFLWIAFDRHCQGFHDKLSSTLVIHAERRSSRP